MLTASDRWVRTEEDPCIDFVWDLIGSQSSKVLVGEKTRRQDRRLLTVAVHELGKDAVLLGETSETSGFKMKPAEYEPVGMSHEHEELWNTYQGLQEQLSRSTHTGSQPVWERAVPAHQILAFPEQTNTKDWTVIPELILPESQNTFSCKEINQIPFIGFGHEHLRQSAVPAHQILAFPELRNTKHWTVVPELVLPESQTWFNLAVFVLPKPKVICLKQGEEPWLQGSLELKNTSRKLPIEQGKSYVWDWSVFCRQDVVQCAR
ncbi:hypothetical protein MC885_002102 [Smutsia gigantea]|nr:hypothetical protein MC885_002102 [Smutsia gigantea]